MYTYTTVHVVRKSIDWYQESQGFGRPNRIQTFSPFEYSVSKFALLTAYCMSCCIQQVTKAIDTLVKNDFTFPQAKAIIAKLKEEWKDVKSWSIPQLQKLGKLLKDFNVQDLKSLTKDQFQVSCRVQKIYNYESYHHCFNLHA